MWCVGRRGGEDVSEAGGGGGWWGEVDGWMLDVGVGVAS